jgi:type II secretory pathway pseudopilin PulG
MIGVLAIIGILAAVVAPRVIESIRDAKVTSAVASVSAAKTAAIGYYQRYDNFPLDSTITEVYDYKTDPSGEAKYTPAVLPLDFGDVLVRQSQLLEQEKAPIGRTAAADDNGVGGVAHSIGCASVPGSLRGDVPYTGDSDFRFKSSGFGTRIVYYYMPNLTVQEAAALASKVNGPFTADAVSDLDFISASLAGKGLATKGGLEGANCWFAPGELPGEYDAYLYVSHQ